MFWEYNKWQAQFFFYQKNFNETMKLFLILNESEKNPIILVLENWLWKSEFDIFWRIVIHHISFKLIMSEMVHWILEKLCALFRNDKKKFFSASVNLWTFYLSNGFLEQYQCKNRNRSNPPVITFFLFQNFPLSLSILT